MFGRRGTPGKTREQVLLMRQAGLLVSRTLDLVGGAARAGRTTADLDALAEDFIRSGGGVPSFLGYHGFTATLCTSVNDVVVHGIPGATVLRDGDVLSVDCGAVVAGWHGDAARSFLVGGRASARDEDLRLVDTTEDALWAGIAALGVGRSLHAVGEAVEDSITAAEERDRAQYGIVEDYVGHGIGAEMHEDPQIPNYRVRGSGPTVRPGFTAAIEPMVTLGSPQTRVLEDDWTVVTTDGRRAAHWEHTVAVGDAGLWVLTAEDGGRERLASRGAAYAPLSG